MAHRISESKPHPGLSVSDRDDGAADARGNVRTESAVAFSMLRRFGFFLRDIIAIHPTDADKGRIQPFIS